MGGTEGFRYVALLARLLASSAALVNPVLYVFMSQKFRRDLAELGGRRWEDCRRFLMGCPYARGNRDTVQPFVLDTTSDGAQN